MHAQFLLWLCVYVLCVYRCKGSDEAHVVLCWAGTEGTRTPSSSAPSTRKGPSDAPKPAGKKSASPALSPPSFKVDMPMLMRRVKELNSVAGEGKHEVRMATSQLPRWKGVHALDPR